MPPSTSPTPLGDTAPFTPTPQRPVRVRARSLPADAHFQPHQHAWAQLAYCSVGILQVMVSTFAEVTTYIVPPSRGVWIAPGALHAVTVLEAAEFRTLYVDESAIPPSWDGCRVIVVSALVRELIQALDQAYGAPGRTHTMETREAMLGTLLLDEIAHADTLALGVPLPRVDSGDKRLRALCEAVLREPGHRASLALLAAQVGASERTMARLFRQELGLGYQQWRQQVALSHALPMISQGASISDVAASSGYASDSAFSAMFKTAMGQSPRHFQQRRGALPQTHTP